MKIYIAGKLGTKDEIETLGKIELVCRSLDLTTFLPHRDVGIVRNFKDVPRIFKEDIKKGFEDCSLIVASLDGLHVGAGTSWELGYAYAKGIPAIGIKTDESLEEALPYLSAILIGSMPIVKSIGELKIKIRETLNLKS